MGASRFSSRFFFSYEKDFFLALEDLLSQISGLAAPMRLVFFFGNGDSHTYAILSQRLRQRVEAYYHFCLRPALSLVFQKPQGGVQMALEVQSLRGYMVSDLDVDDVHALCAENESERWLFTGGLMGYASDLSIAVQSDTVFTKMAALLKKAGASPRHIIRQWNYIENITAYHNQRQHYNMFNLARSKFYEGDDWWMQGYPASTEVGTQGGGTVVDMMALIPKPGCPATVKAIESPVQCNAHQYSASVLENQASAALEHATPKFERAKLVSGAMGSYCFISGTSAIRGEQSLVSGGFEAQCQTVIQAVADLISSENLARQGWPLAGPMQLQSLRVYLKHGSDYPQARYLIQRAFPGISCIFLQSGICRPELLVEIEGIAEEKNEAS